MPSNKVLKGQPATDATPKFLTYTPPDQKSAASSADSTPKFLTYTPPNRTSAASSADASAESHALLAGRRTAGRVPNDPPKFPPAESALAFDGLDEPSEPSRLARWEPAVRMMLVVTEFVSQMKVAPVPGKGLTVATVHVGGKLLATVQRPTDKLLLKSPKGFPGVLKARRLRAARTDEIQVQRFALDTHVLDVMGRPPHSHPACAELAQVTIEIATVLVQQLKHHLCVPRPSELSGAVNPMIPVPGHSSFPGGHALQSMAVAVAVANACGETAAQQAGLHKLAARIAENRMVAGLHYPVDNDSGLALGWLLATCLAKACGSAGVAAPPATTVGLGGAKGLKKTAVPKLDLPLLSVLWARAKAESKPTSPPHAG